MLKCAVILDAMSVLFPFVRTFYNRTRFLQSPALLFCGGLFQQPGHIMTRYSKSPLPCNSALLTLLTVLSALTDIITAAILGIIAVKRSIGSTTGCTVMEKAPTRAFSWLKAPTCAFTFKTLLRHYSERALTPWSLNMKLGPRCNYHKGWGQRPFSIVS